MKPLLVERVLGRFASTRTAVVSLRLAVVLKGVLPDAVKRHAAQKPGWNDAIRVNVIAPHRHCTSANGTDRRIQLLSPLFVQNRVSFKSPTRLKIVSRPKGTLSNTRVPQRVAGSDRKFRTSVTSPAKAAAATMDGLMSKVRPVGLP